MSKNFYLQNGFLVLNQVLDKNLVSKILFDIKDLYQKQIDHLGIKKNNFNESLFEFFEKELNKYIYVNRTATLLPSIYNLAYNQSIISALKDLGIKNPILCQKPTLRMDCKKLAITEEYYKLPAHQDFQAMQGSINSVVVSIPLVDANEDIGCLRVVPKSHKKGLISSSSSLQNKSKLEAIKSVEVSGVDGDDFISVDQNVGDILIISSFLLHKSGENLTNEPRYTILIRYNDLSDNHFLSRGFVSPFATTHESTIDFNFDYKKEIEKMF